MKTPSCQTEGGTVVGFVPSVGSSAAHPARPGPASATSFDTSPCRNAALASPPTASTARAGRCASFIMSRTWPRRLPGARTHPSMRVLFITATRLGDAVLSTGILGHLLRAAPDARFTFAGPGRTEHDMAAPLLEILPGAVDLCGRLSLPAVAACLRRCALFVGNDSGLMHLAAAAGAPTLGLFGPSRVNEYGPSGPNARAAIAPGPDGAAPIRGLTVAAVLDQADALLR